MKNFGGDSSLFMYTRIRAMETIVKLLETRANPAGYFLFICNIVIRGFLCLACCAHISSISYRMKEFKCPDALAEYYKPYSCCIRQWVLEHALFLGPICILVLPL